MNTVRDRRISGIVWASIVYVFASPVALILNESAASSLLYLASWSGWFNLSGVSRTILMQGWPRELPSSVYFTVPKLTLAAVLLVPMLASLATYHHIVFRAAFRRAKDEETATDQELFLDN